MSRNHLNGALSGHPEATLVRRAFVPVGEVYKAADGWKAWAGYDLPTEFCGTWDLKVDAIAAVNRSYTLEREGHYYGPI